MKEIVSFYKYLRDGYKGGAMIGILNTDCHQMSLTHLTSVHFLPSSPMSGRHDSKSELWPDSSLLVWWQCRAVQASSRINTILKLANFLETGAGKLGMGSYDGVSCFWLSYFILIIRTFASYNECNDTNPVAISWLFMGRDIFYPWSHLIGCINKPSGTLCTHHEISKKPAMFATLLCIAF